MTNVTLTETQRQRLNLYAELLSDLVINKAMIESARNDKGKSNLVELKQHQSKIIHSIKELAGFGQSKRKKDAIFNLTQMLVMGDFEQAKILAKDYYREHISFNQLDAEFFAIASKEAKKAIQRTASSYGYGQSSYSQSMDSHNKSRLQFNSLVETLIFQSTLRNTLESTKEKIPHELFNAIINLDFIDARMTIGFEEILEANFKNPTEADFRRIMTQFVQDIVQNNHLLLTKLIEVNRSQQGPHYDVNQIIITGIKASLDNADNLSTLSQNSKAPLSVVFDNALPNKAQTDFGKEVCQDLLNGLAKDVALKLYERKDNRVLFSTGDLKAMRVALKIGRERNIAYADEVKFRGAASSTEQAKIMRDQFEEEVRFFQKTCRDYQLKKPLAKVEKTNTFKGYNPYSSYT